MKISTIGKNCQIAIVIAFSLILCFRASAEDTVDDLLRIESKVQAVVSKALPAVVAVTDGQGFGSGVIVNESGLILTAGHVMASPFDDGYEVIFSDGRRLKAKPLGRNLNVDGGMVQITEPGPFPFVDVSSNPPSLGEWVITLGHSGGYDVGRKPPVRTGRILEMRDHQIITDSVLIGGDSGGPLFNLSGEVIGIHSSIGDSIAENRHVSVNTIRRDWTRLVAGDSWGTLPELAPGHREMKRARMGVIVDKTAANAVVTSVHENSPAARAGIRPGDVITRFDNVKITDSVRLIQLVKTKQPGDGFNVEIQRNGNTFSVYVILERF